MVITNTIRKNRISWSKGIPCLFEQQPSFQGQSDVFMTAPNQLTFTTIFVLQDVLSSYVGLQPYPPEFNTQEAITQRLNYLYAIS